MTKVPAAGWLDRAFWGEMIALGLAAPFFYFSSSLALWAPVMGLVLLAAAWGWRRRCLGYWYMRTPADWALGLLVLLLPMGIWAAPPDLRTSYAYPRVLILIWDLALFSALVVHTARSRRLRQMIAGGFIATGALIAVAALFGTRWEAKVPILTAWLDQLPHPLQGVFSGAKDGFSPNQLAGTLLYVLPFALAFLALAIHQRRWRSGALLAIACGAMGLVMVAAQSRAGFAGLITSVAILLLWPYRWGRWLLGAGLCLALAALLLLPVPDILIAIDHTTKVQGAYGSLSIVGRMEIWSRASAALHDFPFTGVGFGAFRGIVHQIYPLFLIPPDYDIAHAHNFFLQSALDLGIFGLVAILAIYAVVLVQCVVLWRAPLVANHRIWSIGLLAAWLGQATYSLIDAVTLGSKTNILLWWLLAITLGVTSQLAPREQATPLAPAEEAPRAQQAQASQA